MKFRNATIGDIQQMQVIRNSVKENVLSDPSIIKDEDYVAYIETSGKGWVCEMDNMIVGFSIADLKGRNIWALFVSPNYEQKGVGRKLHEMMLDWYFSQTNEDVWLSTATNSRAEGFYRKAGWQEVGITKNGEIKFQISHQQWMQSKKKK